MPALSPPLVAMQLLQPGISPPTEWTAIGRGCLFRGQDQEKERKREERMSGVKKRVFSACSQYQSVGKEPIESGIK